MKNSLSHPRSASTEKSEERVRQMGNQIHQEAAPGNRAHPFRCGDCLALSLRVCPAGPPVAGNLHQASFHLQLESRHPDVFSARNILSRGRRRRRRREEKRRERGREGGNGITRPRFPFSFYMNYYQLSMSE